MVGRATSWFTAQRLVQEGVGLLHRLDKTSICLSATTPSFSHKTGRAVNREAGGFNGSYRERSRGNKWVGEPNRTGRSAIGLCIAETGLGEIHLLTVAPLGPPSIASYGRFDLLQTPKRFRIISAEINNA